MKDRQEVGASTVIAVVVLVGLIIAASAGVGFIYSNFPWVTAVAHPLLRVSVVQPEDENRVEVVLEHVGGDVIDVSKVTVRVRGEDESGAEIELDSDRDNAVKVTPNSSGLLRVAERMRVVFENRRLRVGTRVEVTVIYARSHVIFKSSATLQPGVTPLPILILSLTDPDIDVMETVWRPRLEENEYPRILGYNVDNILAVVTVELGNSTGWVPLVDNEVLDLVRLMKRMNQSSFTFQPGVYDRIRVEISRVTLITADNKILEPLIEETTLEFPIYLQLVAGKRHELRVDVDAPSSLRFTRENELVWNTRVRILHRVLVDDEWSEVVIKGEENVTRIIDGEVAESYPVNPTVPPLDVRCSTHYALVGEEVEFSFEPSENVVEVSWDFDDGENSIEPSPRHAFVEPGGYEVRVTAKYADNTTREGRVALAVTHPAPAVREESVPPPVVSSLLTDVSQFTGQPAVQVPLKVPPGRMVEPSLSLVYGGGHQNGMLGVGWTLEGLGSIERDTREGAPSYDNSDKFVITHGGEAQELVSLGEPSHPPQGFTWTVTGTGQEKVGENEVIYPEIEFDWNVHAQGIERGMWREEFPDVPFNWTVEGKATETWQEEVCHVDPVQQVTVTILANKIEEWSSGYVDHGGANWIPNAGSTISGVHSNIGTFEIPSGYTVYVGGSLEVHAQRIVIKGVLCANGRGYRGARCEACCGEGPGKGCGYWGDHGYGWGGGGAGYGGVGGTGNGIPGSGGRGSAYGSAELISWPPSSDDINMGSGGGAGTAAQGGFDAVGGNGGGKILLISSGDISISGTISANGNNGGYGSGRGEGGGGGGSGGGILLWGDRVTVTGSLQAKGGNGGNSWESGGGGGGAGGRIKVFYRTSASVQHVDVSGGIGGYREIWGRGTWADGGNGASGTYRAVQLGGEWTSVHQEVLEVNLLEIYDSGLDMGELASMLPYPYGGTSTSRYWYEVRSDNPNLIVHFSDTGGNRTVNPSAHVIIKPVEGTVTIETLTEEVTATSSSSATVNMLENWKDVDNFTIVLSPNHGGTLSDPAYEVTDNESKVDTSLSNVQVEPVVGTVYPNQDFTWIVDGSGTDKIIPESYVAHSRTLWNRYASDSSESGSLANTYDEDFGTYHQYYVHHGGDGSCEGSLTIDHTWSKPKRLEKVTAKMYVEDYEGNYQGFRHDYRVYLRINDSWTQVDYGAWAFRSEGGRPYSPEGPTSNVNAHFSDHHHYSVYNNTITGSWDDVTGVRVRVWGGAYSYEGDRQQKLWLRVYEVRAFAQDYSHDSKQGTVSALDGEKDLGGFVGLEGDSDKVSNETYVVSCDNPEVQVYFSDTGTPTTTNRNAHVIAKTDYSEDITTGFVISGTVQAKTDYYEFNWYPEDYTTIENDSSGHATVSALSENDLGAVMPPLIPQHEGTIENVVYTASCDDSRVTLRFSDTGTNQTSDPGASLIASTDYCISTHAPENQVQVSASCSGTGSVSASDGEKDLGGFDATPEPKHGGVVENVVYAVTCDNPNVEVYFSDTGTARTTNPNAHVMGRTDYQETALVAEYRAKHMNNSRVKFNGEYWELWDTSGTRYTFGSSPNSRMVNANGAFRWLLDRVTDAHGNYMTISYAQDGGYAYPASIEYTGHENTGESPWVRIDFVYEDRPDPVTSYRAGSEIVMSKRLSKMEMRVEGELIRTYELGYSLSPATQRSLLSSITERAGTGEALPPITFEYSQGAWKFDGETTEENFLSERVKNGDFSQGLSDWTVSSYGVDCSVEKNHLKFSTSQQGGGGSGSGHNWGAEFSQSLGHLEAGMSATLSYAGYLYQRTEEGSGGVDQSVILVKPDGSQVTLDSRSIPHSDDADWDEQYSVSKDISSHITQSGEYKLIVRLANGWAWGDRGGGWCYIQVGFYFVSVEAWHPGSFRVSRGGGLLRTDLNGDAHADLLTITRNGDWLARVDGQTSSWLCFKPLASEQLLFGDFNGDGKFDVGIYSAQDVVRVALSTGEGFNAPVHWPTGLEGSEGKLIAGDFNGDGKTDVLAVKAGGLAVALSAGDRFVPAGPWLEGVNTDGLEVLAADFNADHLTDIALVDKSSGTWQVALSTGRGFTSPAVWISGFSSGSVAAMDLNRDGLSDAVAFSSGELRFARSTGRSFVSPQLFTSGLERMPALVDFNADGLPDLSVFDPDTYVHRVTLSTGEPADRLIAARNELGGEVSYTYLPSTSFGVELPTVVQVVEKMVRNDGVGDPSTTTYAYEDGKFQVGQGFVGFGTSSATLAGSTTTTRFHLDTFRKGLAYETQVSDGEGNLYFKKHITWELREPVAGTRISLMTREDIYTYDGDESYKLSATLYEYDNYGNLVKVQNLGDLAVEGDERTTCIEYAYNPERWIMTPSHTWILDADNTKAAETWYYYDGATSHASSPLKGDLTKEESWLDTGDNPVTQMSYDVYGNLVSTTDARGNTTTTEYDSAHHLFPVKVTNPLGHVQTSTHDLATGRLLSQTDFNGVTTSYEYDGFGRLLKVIAPGDAPANPTKSFTYDLSSHPAKTVVQTRSTCGASQTSSAYVFFDGFGRVVQTRHQAEDVGQQVVECWSFNQLGKVEHEWLPYLAPTSSSYSPPDPGKPKVRYEYDVMGRVVKMTYPDETSVTAIHSDWTTTTTDAKGSSIRKTYDAYGQLVKIEEFNAGDTYTTTYSYDAMGNLIRIVDAKGNTTTMTYDSLGRRTSLDDPDMGEWLYWYDANGNLTGERDAKGEVISYTYDALNRLMRKGYPSGQDVEYEYDSPTVPYSIGRRTAVTDTSGSTAFYYDELGREIKTVKRIDGTDYVIERSFDSTGRLASVKYPDGEVVYYAYNPAGLIEAVVGDRVYVREVDYDAQGRITSIEYGNGIRTTKSYDALRLLTLRTNGGAFQDLSYEYDAAGNITRLVDHLHGAEKTFSYDNLNRLTYAASPYGTQCYAYDEIGNLIEKDGINYEYGQAGEKPHAVTAGSDGFAAGYDPNGNMIWRRDHNGVTSYTYDSEDRLVRVEREGQTVVEFVYDGAGGRVKKITPLVSRIYIGNLYEVDNLGWTAKHVFLGAQRIATVEDGGTHFYHPDHLGSANVVTDEHGNLVQLIEHDPFGSIAVSSGSGEVRYRFMGKESDDETGLVYFGARYYDPVLGRFITADPLVQSLEDPQLLNRYAFCRNNPLVFQEAQGNFFWAAVAIVCIAVTVASFVSPSFNAWMHRTFGDFAAPIQTAAMVVATFAIAGPVLSVQSAGATFAEVVAAAQVPAAAAAAATAVLDTGEGRQFISWLANEVFDDAFGMGPKAAYVTANVVAHAGVSWTFERVFAALLTGPPGRTSYEEGTLEDLEKAQRKGWSSPVGEGDKGLFGANYGSPTGKVDLRDYDRIHRIVRNGEVIGARASRSLGIPFLPFARHHQVWMRGYSGFAVSGWSYSIPFIGPGWGTCHQATNLGLLLSGSSATIPMGIDVFFTTLVHGNYGGGFLTRVYWARSAAND